MRNNIPYVSIKSILYDLSTMIDPLYWNESYVHEWAIKGYRKMGIRPAMQEEVCIALVEDHKAILPRDLRYIIQLAYRVIPTEEELDWIKAELLLDNSENNPALPHMTDPDNIPQRILGMLVGSRLSWLPMRLATNSFIKTATIADTNFQIPVVDTNTSADLVSYNRGGIHEYTVDPNLCLTTTLKNGILLISYVKYATDKAGDTLIPDDENLKDALFHYCMYRYWMSKSLAKEEGTERLRDYHLQMYDMLKTKTVGKMNMPSVDEMENLRRMNSRLLPSSNEWSNFFSGLNSSEILNF